MHVFNTWVYFFQSAINGFEIVITYVLGRLMLDGGWGSDDGDDEEVPSFAISCYIIKYLTRSYSIFRESDSYVLY